MNLAGCLGSLLARVFLRVGNAFLHFVGVLGVREKLRDISCRTRRPARSRASFRRLRPSTSMASPATAGNAWHPQSGRSPRRSSLSSGRTSRLPCSFPHEADRTRVRQAQLASAGWQVEAAVWRDRSVARAGGWRGGRASPAEAEVAAWTDQSAALAAAPSACEQEHNEKNAMSAISCSAQIRFTLLSWMLPRRGPPRCLFYSRDGTRTKSR